MENNETKLIGIIGELIKNNEKVNEERVKLLGEIGQLRLEIQELRTNNTESYEEFLTGEGYFEDTVEENLIGALDILKQSGLIDNVDSVLSIEQYIELIKNNYKHNKEYEKLENLCTSQSREIERLKLENKVVKESVGCNGFEKDKQLKIEQLTHEIETLKNQLNAKEITIKNITVLSEHRKEKLDKYIIEVDELRNKVKNLENEKSELSNELSYKQELSNTNCTEITKLRNKVIKLKEEKEKLYNKHRYASQKVVKLEEKIKELEATIAQLQEDLVESII